MRLRRLKQIYALVDRCLQYGFDPDAWRYELCIGARDLFRAKVVLCGEFSRQYDDDKATVLHHLDIGWQSPQEQLAFMRYQVDGAQRIDPMRRELVRRSRRFIVASAGSLIGPNAYFGSEVYDRYIRPSGLGDQLVGIADVGPRHEGRSQTLSCLRAIGDAPFGQSDIRMMQVLLLEIIPLVGNRLADATDPILRLTPRLRDALYLILEGRTEAAAAAEMKVSQKTFHKYVTALYRAFEIRSRGELHARFSGVARAQLPVRLYDARHNRLRREGAPMARPWRSPGAVLSSATTRLRPPPGA